MHVILARSSLRVKWSSTPCFAGMCRGAGLTCITSPTCPAPDKHPPPRGLSSQAQSDNILVAKRAAIRSSSELFCWVCPSKPRWCWVEAQALVPAGLLPSFTSVPACPRCSQHSHRCTSREATHRTGTRSVSEGYRAGKVKPLTNETSYKGFGNSSRGTSRKAPCLWRSTKHPNQVRAPRMSR